MKDKDEKSNGAFFDLEILSPAKFVSTILAKVVGK